MTQITIDLTVVDENERITPDSVKNAILEMCNKNNWLFAISVSEIEKIEAKAVAQGGKVFGQLLGLMEDGSTPPDNPDIVRPNGTLGDILNSL